MWGQVLSVISAEGERTGHSTAQGEAGELILLVGAGVWGWALHVPRGLGFGSVGGGTGKGIRCPRGQCGICAKTPWGEVAFPRVQVPGKQVFGEAPIVTIHT